MSKPLSERIADARLFWSRTFACEKCGAVHGPYSEAPMLISSLTCEGIGKTCVALQEKEHHD